MKEKIAKEGGLFSEDKVVHIQDMMKGDPEKHGGFPHKSDVYGERTAGHLKHRDHIVKNFKGK